MENGKDYVIEKEAFKSKAPHRGYSFQAFYLTKPKGEALIQIFKGEKKVKEFLFPAYKIWNIPAHQDDIIDGLEEDSESGLLIAGSDGLGGNSYVPED